MNRELLVTLLHKNIEDLNMITAGFMEMKQYPAPLIQLAKLKTEDINDIINQLSEIKEENFETKDFHKETVEDIPTNLQPEEVVEEDVIIEDEVEKSEDPIVLETEESEIIIEEEDPVLENEIAEEDSSEPEPIEIVSEVIESVTPAYAVESELAENVTTETATIEPNAQTEQKTVPETLTKATIADKIGNGSISRNDSLSKNENTLSSTIANKKITDIKQAISLGDRFRFQRELFKGNGEDMNKTLNYINQLATLEEVTLFLESKYGWDNENESKDYFYQIIKRKFI